MDKEIWNNEDWIKLLQTVIVLVFIFIVAGFEGEAIMCKGDAESYNINSKENNFNTTEWILIENNAVCDTSIEKLRLNYLNGTAPYYENMNDYTQVDGLNAITIDSATQVHYLWANWRGTTDTYLYKTKNNLDGFTLRFALYVERIDNNAVSFRAGLVHFTSVLGGLTDSYNSDSFFVMFLGTTSTTQYRLGCIFTRTGNPNFLDDGVFTSLINIDTWYYVKCVKSGSTWSLYVYSDTEYSVLVTSDTQNLGANLDANYFIFGSTVGFSTIVNIEWYTKNAFFGGYYDSGDIYTSNLMDNATIGNLCYEFLVNATTLSGTTITVDISDDNVTWLNNIISFSSGLTDKQYGVYLYPKGWTDFYARFEFTSTNPLNTPTIDHIIFQHEYTITSTSNNDWVMAILFILVPLMLVLAYALKRSKG